MVFQLSFQTDKLPRHCLEVTTDRSLQKLQYLAVELAWVLSHELELLWVKVQKSLDLNLKVLVAKPFNAATTLKYPLVRAPALVADIPSLPPRSVHYGNCYGVEFIWARHPLVFGVVKSELAMDYIFAACIYRR